MNPVPNDEAAAQIRNKPALAQATYDKLLPELKSRAFTVSGVLHHDQIAAIRDIVATIPEGANWQKAQKEILAKLPFHIDPDATPEEQKQQRAAANRHAELIIRQHTSQAYAAADWNLRQELADFFPFQQYITAGDGTVRPSHAALHGIVLPIGHPFWDNHTPPWDWGCNCQAIGITESDVADIEAEDADKPEHDRRVLRGPRLRKLETQRVLDRGPDRQIDVRAPGEMGRKGSYRFNPADLRLSLDDLRDRYDPETFNDFRKWAQNELVDTDRTVWDWLSEG